MLGFISSNRSSLYLQYLVWTQAKLPLPPSNSVVLLGYGGIISTPCSLQGMLSPGMSFGQPLEHIIFPKDCWSES
jgi:hypothetical protein